MMMTILTIIVTAIAAIVLIVVAILGVLVVRAALRACRDHNRGVEHLGDRKLILAVGLYKSDGDGRYIKVIYTAMGKTGSPESFRDLGVACMCKSQGAGKKFVCSPPNSDFERSLDRLGMLAKRSKEA